MSTCPKCGEETQRKCTACNKDMLEGYCINGGEEYYCTEQCLLKAMTIQEYEELYDDGNGDSYYTEWEENEHESECTGPTIRYVFKAKTTKTIRIQANNLEQAMKEFMENHVVINREKVR